MPAYSKTNWVDGSVPAIDATNLNKIEQGIFDSLRQDGSTTMSGQLVTTAGSAATPAIAPTGDTNTGIYFPAADTIGITTNGLEKFRITSGGFVGIGGVPNSKFNVYDANATIQINEVASGGTGVAALRLKHGNNYFGWYVGADNALVTYDYQASAERMRITSTGNVGIGDFGSNPPPVQFSVSSLTGGVVGVTTKRASGTNASPISMSYGFYGYLDGEKARITATERTGNTNASDLNFQVKDSSDVLQSRLYISTAGNVGIGTTNPTSELHVYANGGVADLMVETNTTGGDSKIALKCNGAGGRHWYWQTGDTGSTLNGRLRLWDSTAGAERFTITSTGNVGIGTNSPQARLDVVTASGTTALARFAENSTQLPNITVNSTANGMQLKSSYSTGMTGAFDLVSEGGSSYISFATNGAANERMRITSTGNVGIGTISPTAYSGYTTLELDNATQSGLISFKKSGVQTAYMLGGGTGFSGFTIKTFGTNNLDLVTDQAYPIRFSIAGVDRGRWDSNGYLLVGYTSSNGAYPLQVNGQIFATSSTIATSDGRYKKDVVALDGALDIVKALNPVQFSWKDHPVHKFNTDVPTVGFIAQEVEQALADKSYLTSIIKKSECTWETETGETVEREVTRDVEKQVEREITEEIDGEEVTRTVTETVIEQVTEIVTEPVKETHTEEFLGIAESNLIAILTKAVKELAAEVEALKAQLNK